MKCRSEWQSPATEVRIRTSRGPGFGRLTSSITSGLLTSCRTAAFIGVSPYRCLFRLLKRGKRAPSPHPTRGYPSWPSLLAEVGYIRLRWERVGVRGYDLSIGRNPSPGSQERSDLSRWER